MPQKDFITTPTTVTKTFTFDQKQLYKYFKKWLTSRHYVVVEQQYTEKVTPDSKRVYNFSWYTEKRAGEYTKLTIELGYNAEVENVQVELHDGTKKTAQRGEVSVTLQGYIQKDTENEWALTRERPHRRLIREFYDKLVAKGRYAQYESQMKKDIRAIVSDFKTYAKTHRYD